MSRAPVAVVQPPERQATTMRLPLGGVRAGVADRCPTKWLVIGTGVDPCFSLGVGQFASSSPTATGYSRNEGIKLLIPRCGRRPAVQGSSLPRISETPATPAIARSATHGTCGLANCRSADVRACASEATCRRFKCGPRYRIASERKSLVLSLFVVRARRRRHSRRTEALPVQDSPPVSGGVRSCRWRGASRDGRIGPGHRITLRGIPWHRGLERLTPEALPTAGEALEVNWRTRRGHEGER